MTPAEYLDKHHAICEQAIGTIHLFLKRDKNDQALREVELCINELTLLQDYYKVNSTTYMIKTVLGSGDWKKDGGLYRSWKLGIRNLEEAFKIVSNNTN